MECKHEWEVMNLSVGHYDGRSTREMTICRKCLMTLVETKQMDELYAAWEEIKKLKCCGNCKYWLVRQRCIKHYIYVSNSDYCRDWSLFL